MNKEPVSEPINEEALEKATQKIWHDKYGYAVDLPVSEMTRERVRDYIQAYVSCLPTADYDEVVALRKYIDEQCARIGQWDGIAKASLALKWMKANCLPPAVAQRDSDEIVEVIVIGNGWNERFHTDDLPDVHEDGTLFIKLGEH